MLNPIHPPVGSNKKKKILGRGNSSGRGRTSTKGHKGRKARAGGQTIMGFEGGQMKLVMRMPKVGFSNYPHRILAVPVNLSALEKHYAAAEEVSLATLKTKGVIRKKDNAVKLLGTGTLTKKLTIAKGLLASATARKAIEAAGGSFVG